MLQSLLNWFGFGQPQKAPAGSHQGHGTSASADAKSHGHTHGVVDASIATSERGLWAIKWSFAILAVTAALQFAVVLVSGSVALLADMIHNVGDAVTAVPLGIAFVLARRKPNPRFTYGYGRAEDLAGVSIVLIILFSAIVAAYEAIDRLLHPQAITQLGWVMVAGVVGFIGNEVVAVFRIRIGREINSAALIADGYHARTDGLTSLAVVIGAIGVHLGFPLADPLIGLLITIAIFGIVWQSAKAVLTRMLDGVEPDITAEIRHAAEHIPGIRQVLDIRTRWIGHKLTTELDVAVDSTATLIEADRIATRYQEELFEHMPALASARIRARPFDGETQTVVVAPSGPSRGAHGHHHAPNPVSVQGHVASGILQIIDTPDGERLEFRSPHAVHGLTAEAVIHHGNDRLESLPLQVDAQDPRRMLSAVTPQEPHEFDAELRLRQGGASETLSFRMSEPS